MCQTLIWLRGIIINEAAKFPAQSYILAVVEQGQGRRQGMQGRWVINKSAIEQDIYSMGFL